MPDKLAQPRARADDFLPLSEFERRMLQRLFGNPGEIPPEFWAAVNSKMEINGPRLLAESVAGIKGEEWREIGASGQPAFANSWVNYDSTRKARFRKDATGVVHLAGLIKSGTINTAAFTLPDGYWPDYTDSTNVSAIFSVASNSLFGVVSVEYNGVVKPNVGSNVYVSLDGITYRTPG